MGRQWARAGVHLAVAFCGIAVAAAVCAVGADRIPSKKSKCVVLNTCCWSAAAWAYDDPSKDPAIVADNAVLLSNMMNFVWCNEYAGDHHPMCFNLGTSGGMALHLASIYQAAATPGVRSILYINAPGGLLVLWRPEDATTGEAALECIREQYPETAADVAVYLKAVYASPFYKQARDQCQGEWRARIEEEKRKLHIIPVEDQGWQTGRDVSAPRRLYRGLVRQAADVKEFLFEDLCYFDHMNRTRPHLSRLCPRNDRTIKVLDACASRYLDPVNRKPFRRMPAREAFWASCGGEEAWHAWVNIVGTICRARGVTLVYYIPPHLHVSEDEYRSAFKPAYLDVVRKAFAGFDNVNVVDCTMDRTLNQYDIIWHDQNGVLMKFGYLGNAVGRLKQARLMVQVLLDVGLLKDHDARPRYLGSAWPGEQALPRVTDSAIEYVRE